MGFDCDKFSKKHADNIIIVNALFAAAAWILFISGFGMEAANPRRLSGWANKVEKFTWYLFSIFGILAIIVVIANAIYKRPYMLSVSLLVTGIGLLFAGGPLDETGHYLWQCHSADPITGLKFTSQGCQEETYDNMSMMFYAIFFYALFMSVVLYFTSHAPTTARFSIRGAANLDLPMI